MRLAWRGICRGCMAPLERSNLSAKSQFTGGWHTYCLSPQSERPLVFLYIKQHTILVTRRQTVMSQFVKNTLKQIKDKKTTLLS